MLTVCNRWALEFVEINGVWKHAFWAIILELAENQSLDPHSYGVIENELGWVNISEYELIPTNVWVSPEALWLHHVISGFESLYLDGIPANMIFSVQTYVIPFDGGHPSDVVYYNGIPGDVYFIQVYDIPWDIYSMHVLWGEHLRAQSFYTTQLAKPPAVRRNEYRWILLHLILSTCDPHWCAVYNLLYGAWPKNISPGFLPCNSWY
ncbi:hypothetical protein SUGI_0992540 [Cryptomeria japonica]|nr:hypothetical protein SUGI_0992540 [Cryptomeria japonica]